jgi:iron complex transport system substrate-binding protein
MKKLLTLFMTLFVAIGLLAACGQDNAEQEAANNTQTEENANKETAETESAFPVTITDASDEEVVIEEKPERIVSLIPSNTEITISLGLGEEIVGVSDYDNYPEEVNEKEKIGGMELNVEKIIGLNPDLVLAHASGAHTSAEGLKQLKDAGITVLVVNDAAGFNDVYDSIKMIGQATGTSDKAQELVDEMSEKLFKIQEKAASISEEEQVTVWLEVSPAPDIYTAGKGTFMNQMLEIIHAKNAAADQDGWVKFTEEDAVQLNPDVIVTTYGYYVENPKEQILSRDGWQDVPAVKNERVYDVHSDLVTRSGPRLVEGVEELAAVIYPDVFAK